jgi:hypothetical protein
MAYQYETYPFSVIRGALLNMAEQAYYMETEHESGPANPCPDYCRYLLETIDLIMSAESFADLAAIHWIAAKADIPA